MNNDEIHDFFLYHVIQFLNIVEKFIPIGVFFLCLFIICFLLNRVIVKRAEQILQNWITKKKYKLVYYKIQRPAKHYRVFYIEVITADGQLKRGYIRCGDFLLGVLSDVVDISWER